MRGGTAARRRGGEGVGEPAAERAVGESRARRTAAAAPRRATPTVALRNSGARQVAAQIAQAFRPCASGARATSASAKRSGLPPGRSVWTSTGVCSSWLAPSMRRSISAVVGLRKARSGQQRPAIASGKQHRKAMRAMSGKARNTPSQDALTEQADDDDERQHQRPAAARRTWPAWSQFGCRASRRANPIVLSPSAVSVAIGPFRRTRCRRGPIDSKIAANTAKARRVARL